MISRAYGDAPPGVWRDGLAAGGRWAVRNRVPWVAGGWLLLLTALALLRNPSLTSAAARASYILLAVYALSILVNETSEPSLGHAGFMALGAYGTATLRLRLGIDGMTSALLATLVVGAAGWVMALGATRLRPAMLALLTWTFGWALYVGLGALPGLSGGVAGISYRAPLRVRWEALGVDITFGDIGHFILGSVLLGLLLLLYRSAQTSVIGRGWSALRDGRTLAGSLGYDVAALRRWAFAVAAAVAALAGSLGAQLLQVVDPSLYSPLQSVNLYAAVLIGGPLGFIGPALGALVTEGAPFLVDQASQLLGTPLGPGRQLAAATVTITALLLTALLQARRARGGAVTAVSPALVPVGGHHPGPETAAAGPVITASGLSLSFAGLRALDSVDIALRAGTIHGLIGANGSGKSTLLRCLSGTLLPDDGTVVMDGREVQGTAEPARVASGIARTFQRTAILPHLRVRDHVEVGLRQTYGNARWFQALFRTPAYRADIARGRDRSLELLGIFGLSEAANREPGTLSSGRQRLLQVATAAAAGARVLLLDEPSAGLGREEATTLHSALLELAREGTAILLIEHNMRFLAGLASEVTVLHSGQVVATGSPEEVVADERVRRAYLGTSAQ